MNDPVLALKYFCLSLVIELILFIATSVAKAYRMNYGKIKLFPSTLESVLIIMMAIISIMATLCLLWTIIAWIW